VLDVEIGLEKVEYNLREGNFLVIRHETEEIRLTRENPAAVREVSSSKRSAGGIRACRRVR
jgi:alpha,alpha-trehalose phosphorylase